MPAGPPGLGVLLEVHLMHKAGYERAYEANNRTDWVGIPVRGILDLLRPE